MNERNEQPVSSGSIDLDALRREMCEEVFRVGNHPALGVPVECVERWVAALASLGERRGTPIAHELNAWRELGEEMGRVLSLLSKEQYEDLFPDWFGPRLFDLQVKAGERRGTQEEAIWHVCPSCFSGRRVSSPAPPQEQP